VNRQRFVDCQRVIVECYENSPIHYPYHVPCGANDVTVSKASLVSQCLNSVGTKERILCGVHASE
jgi:hypothetical protein